MAPTGRCALIPLLTLNARAEATTTCFKVTDLTYLINAPTPTPIEHSRIGLSQRGDPHGYELL